MMPSDHDDLLFVGVRIHIDQLNLVKTDPNPNPFVAKIGFVKSRGIGFRRMPTFFKFTTKTS